MRALAGEVDGRNPNIGAYDRETIITRRHIADTIPEPVCEKKSCTVGFGGGNWFLGPAELPDS